MLYLDEMEEIKFVINSQSPIGSSSIPVIATHTLITVIARYLGADLLGHYILAIGYCSVLVNFVGIDLSTLYIHKLASGGQKPQSI